MIQRTLVNVQDLGNYRYGQHTNDHEMMQALANLFDVVIGSDLRYYVPKGKVMLDVAAYYEAPDLEEGYAICGSTWLVEDGPAETVVAQLKADCEADGGTLVNVRHWAGVGPKWNPDMQVADLEPILQHCRRM